MGDAARKHLLERILDPGISYVYIVAQKGAGCERLLADIGKRSKPGAFALFNGWDRSSAEERATFRRFLSKPPSGRRIVVTGEDPLIESPFSSSLPEEQCFVTDADLALDREDAAQLLKGSQASRDFIDFAFSLTQGHAGALTFVCRTLARDGERAARDLGSSAYLPLFEFVRGWVLASLSEEERRVLLSVAAIGSDPGADAIAASLSPDAIERAIDSLLRRRAVAEVNGRIEIIPFIEAAVKNAFAPEIHGIAQQTIDNLRRRGQFIASARAALTIGATSMASNLVRSLPTPDLFAWEPQLEAVVDALPEADVAPDPRLWLAAFRRRRIFIDSNVLQSEGETLLALFDNEVDPLITKAARAYLASIYEENFQHAQADRLFNELAGECAAVPDAADRIAFAIRSSVLARRGDMSGATAALQMVRITGISTPLAAKMANILSIERAARNGDWQAERIFHQRQLELARSRDDRLWLMEMLLEYAYAAATNNDLDTLNACRDEMRAVREFHLLGPYAAFSSIGASPINFVADRFGLPRMRSMMHFVEAYFSGSATEACARYGAAREELQDSALYAMRAVNAVALSQVLPRRRAEFLDEAASLATQLNWVSLQGSISHLLIGELPSQRQPLRALVVHLRELADTAARPNVMLNLLGGTVACGNRTLNVSRKVFDLLVALAVRARPLHRDDLCEMIWPDEEVQDAVNALKMTVRRARLQCGDPNVVTFAKTAYALGSHVAVDVRQIRADCELAFKHKEHFKRLRGKLNEYYLKLAAGTPKHLQDYEWFVGTNASLQNLQIELGSMLARDALAREDFESVRALTPVMLECDPCDEFAWEITIRAHIQSGDVAAARRAAAEYASLAQRSGCRVSPALVGLAGRHIA